MMYSRYSWYDIISHYPFLLFTSMFNMYIFISIVLQMIHIQWVVPKWVVLVTKWYIFIFESFQHAHIGTYMCTQLYSGINVQNINIFSFISLLFWLNHLKISMNIMYYYVQLNSFLA